MDPVYRFPISSFSCRFRIVILACMIVLGSFCGILTAFSYSPDFSSLMDIASYDVSFAGLLTISFFPLLVALFSVIKSKWCFLFPLCFLRFYLFGYCAWGIMISIGHGGWLFSFLYLFCGHMILPLEVYFMIRCMVVKRDTRFRDVAIYFCLIFLVLFLDYRFISPLLIVIT